VRYHIFRSHDVAKYFAIIPAMFVAAFPQLHILNIMRLHTREVRDPITVIFNALSLSRSSPLP